MKVDKEQKQAIEFNRGACLVLAGPGSGKTFVLVERLKYMLRVHGVAPEKILVLTFTKAAAKEMRDRFLNEMGERQTRITFGIFHSVFYRMLKEYHGFSGDKILDARMQEHIIIRCCRLAGIDVGGIPDLCGTLVRQVSFIRNSGMDPEDFEPKEVEKAEFLEFYKLYEREKKAMEKIDFDDMLLLTREFLDGDRDALHFWQDRFSYILIDEAQDMNSLQYEIMRKLAKPEDNIFAVGDDDQSIYAFRGADPKLMLHFRDDYPGAELIQLKKNYRCAVKIMKSAVRLISHNKLRFEKVYQAGRSDAGRIRRIEAEDEKTQSELIVRDISSNLQNDPKRQLAVLFRSHRQGKMLQEILRRKGMSVYAKEHGGGIYDSFIFGDIRAYLSLDPSAMERRLLLRVLNRPQRYLPRGCLDEEVITPGSWLEMYANDPYMQASISEFIDQIKILHRFSPAAALKYLLKGMDYERFLLDEQKREACSADECRQALALAEDIAKAFPGRRAFLRELERRRKEEAQKPTDTNRSEGKITLMSYHGAKGLEFDTVYLVHVNDGITPTYQAIESDSDDLLEEERRMFYVAITRAKEELVIATIKRRGNSILYPSRFIDEMFQKNL